MSWVGGWVSVYLALLESKCMCIAVLLHFVRSCAGSCAFDLSCCCLHQGIITVSNHVSAVDDPGTIAALVPAAWLIQPKVRGADVSTCMHLCVSSLVGAWASFPVSDPCLTMSRGCASRRVTSLCDGQCVPRTVAFTILWQLHCCGRARCVIACVWFGLVWFGLVWFGLVWVGLVRCLA